jgi:hypothetical protein
MKSSILTLTFLYAISFFHVSCSDPRSPFVVEPIDQGTCGKEQFSTCQQFLQTKALSCKCDESRCRVPLLSNCKLTKLNKCKAQKDCELNSNAKAKCLDFCQNGGDVCNYKDGCQAA